MKILIAEDDAVSRRILQRALGRLGHECLVAEDGARAWELFQESDVDVVISDRMMPGLDGMELCCRIREQPRETYTYFIFLTALDDKQHLLAGMRAGADDYLAKPLDLAELQASLVAASRVTSLHQRLAEQRAELERLNLQLFGQARRDPLTQLGNRLQMWEDLETVQGMVERYGHTYCLALCDVDSFKLYNDNYGHPAGDEVLQSVGNTIGASGRKGDVTYRYDGEEFLLVLPEQPLDSAAAAMENRRIAVEGLAIPHRAKTPPGVVTISAGISTLVPGDDKSLETVLKEADTALYHAKNSGRNRVCTYSNGRSTLLGQPR